LVKTDSSFKKEKGYISGEETALCEAIEGKRAEPRNKPPYLAEKAFLVFLLWLIM